MFLSVRFCSRWWLWGSGTEIFRSLPQHNLTELQQCQLPLLEVRHTARELDEPGEGLRRRIPALARHHVWTDHLFHLVLVLWSSEYYIHRAGMIVGRGGGSWQWVTIEIIIVAVEGVPVDGIFFSTIWYKLKLFIWWLVLCFIIIHVYLTIISKGTMELTSITVSFHCKLGNNLRFPNLALTNIWQNISPSVEKVPQYTMNGTFLKFFLSFLNIIPTWTRF